MGCVNSTCMLPPKNEVEIDIDDNEPGAKIVLLRPEPKKDNPSIFIKDYVDQIPDLAKLNQIRTGIPTDKHTTAENDNRMTTREKSDPFEVKLGELQLRIGKTFSELNREYESLIGSIRMARKDFLQSTSADFDPNKEDRIFSVLNQWKNFVYEDIAKKTGEIKNIITYSSSGKTFCIAHEVEGWKDVTLVKGFCDYVDIHVDESFYKICKTKLNDISCLTVVVWIQVVDAAKAQISVGCNIVKPAEKSTLTKFLEGTVEKKNITMWFDANAPVPIEFGMMLSHEENELIAGFYFFDASPHLNLSRALTGLQAYGADINESNISIFKAIPGEELKIYFAMNKYGAQRVKLQMPRLPEQLQLEILDKLDKKYDARIWESFKNIFHGITIKTYYTLEYSSEGYTFYCTREVGSEVGSKVYLEDF